MTDNTTNGDSAGEKDALLASLRAEGVCKGSAKYGTPTTKVDLGCSNCIIPNYAGHGGSLPCSQTIEGLGGCARCLIMPDLKDKCRLCTPEEKKAILQFRRDKEARKRKRVDDDALASEETDEEEARQQPPRKKARSALSTPEPVTMATAMPELPVGPTIAAAAAAPSSAKAVTAAAAAPATGKEAVAPAAAPTPAVATTATAPSTKALAGAPATASGKEAKAAAAAAAAAATASPPASPVDGQVCAVLGVVGRCDPYQLVVWAGPYPLIDSTWEPEQVSLSDGKSLPCGLIYVEAMGYYSSKEDALKITNALKALKLGVIVDPRVILKKFNGDEVILDLVTSIPSPGNALAFYVK